MVSATGERTGTSGLTVAAGRARAALIPLLLIVLTIAKGALWAGLIAPLDAPDEPSHFNYVVQVKEGYRLPVVVLVSPAGLLTPPSTPLNGDVRAWFARYDYKFFRSMPYESAQPPLYYWTASFLTRAITVNASSLLPLLYACRMVSVLLGAGAVLALWLTCRWVWPAAHWLSIAAPLALTLSPEFTFSTATVSNDAGAILAGACLLALWAFGLHSVGSNRFSGPRGIGILCLMAGVFTAAGMLTKLTFAVTVPASLVWVYYLARTSTRGKRRSPVPLWIAGAAILGLTALVATAPWLLRNLSVYGEPTGARAIFNLIHGIYWQRAGLPDGQWFSSFPIVDFTGKSVRSFWALFGWATVWLDDWVYWLLALFAVAGVAGLSLWQRPQRLLPEAVRILVLLAGLLVIFSFASYIGYNSLVEYQPHSRYTFASLGGVFFLIVLGLGAYSLRTSKRLGVLAFLCMLTCVHVAGMVVLVVHTQSVLAAVQK